MPHSPAHGSVEWNARLALVAFLALICTALLPEQASASALQLAICNIVWLITGGVAKATATLAIIFIGISAMIGKVSWGMALVVATGIGIVFGAGYISVILGAGNSCALA